VGTQTYIDPFLRLRGAWDHAADRWSAAVTLHEMIAGVRPGFGGPGSSALDSEAKLVLAAERFDASVRDGLVDFFQRALARDVEQRFVNAQEMRLAWIAALDTPSRARATPEDGQDGAPAPQEVDYAAIEGSTPIDALPLTPRARNALDRAGLLRAEDLLALADNRLSAIRGIGTRVAREILNFRNSWRQARALTVHQPEPFFPGYRGEDLLLDAAKLEDAARLVLRDAGLRTLGAVASAPRTISTDVTEKCSSNPDPRAWMISAWCRCPVGLNERTAPLRSG